MKVDFSTKYDIGNVVYFNLPDSEALLIVDINFMLKTQTFVYQIMDNNGNKGWYSEVELTKERQIAQ